jgi:cytochrome c-type biogenesis protein CcmH
MMRCVVVVLTLLVTILPAFAVNPDETLADPAQEARARAISSELRCLVCQNQSIDESNAELAKDLRLLVRERIVAGDSDKAVLDYLVARYGEFVLLKPRVNERTILLWIAPLALTGAAAAALVAMGRRNRRESEPLLTEEERKHLDSLLR